MNTATRLSSFALGLMAAGASLAQTPAAQTPAKAPAKVVVAPGSDFAMLDKNKDGRLSVAETEGTGDLRRAFQQLDRNHDGSLSVDEFAVFGGKTAPPKPVDASTAPSGSGNAQHMPKD